MRIAFIAQPKDPVVPPRQNSIGICIYEAGKRLAKTHDVFVYMGKKGPSRKGHAAHIDGMRFIPVPLIHDHRLMPYLKRFLNFLSIKKPLFSSYFYYLFYIIRISLRIKKQRIDIVHIHNYSQFVPIIKLFNPRAKTVLHMHCEWLTQLNRGTILSRIEKADCIISCSNYITQKNKNAFPEIADRFHTLYNGFRTEIFHPPVASKENAPAAAPDAKIEILYVGRISPEKGVHLLLDAFAALSAEHENLYLRLIGPQKPPPREYIADISDDPMVRDLSELYSDDFISFLKGKLGDDLAERVIIEKPLPQADLVNHYRHARLFAFPSIWEEPFGMPIIEAMACGLPVVVSDGGGIPEIVRNFKTGILAERGNKQALVDGMRRLLEDRTLYNDLKINAQRHVLKRFTWDRISEDLQLVYDHIS